MLNKSIRVLNFDDSITRQKSLLSRYKTRILDLKDLCSQTRLWASVKTRDAIENRLKDSDKSCLTFLGSGDFHHISELLISQFNEPISLVVFDFHPDWDILPPHFACGSWVTRALKNKNILKCILIGMGSSDLSSFRIQSANLNALRKDRAEIYPYEHSPTSVCLKKVPQSVSFNSEKSFLCNKIYWNQLKGKNLKDFLLKILQRLPTKKVYVSIDKDCLTKEYAITNWEEGKLSLEELLLMLKLIKEDLEIMGLDITGDYSEIMLRGGLKRIFSNLDHPKDVPALKLSAPEITAINEQANLKILEILFS